MQYDIDVSSPSGTLFLGVREVLLNEFNLEETRHERVTSYSNGHSGICHMRTLAEGVDIGFLNGADLSDKYQRLRGRGKKLRVLHLTYLDMELLLHYLREAVTANDR